MSPAAMTMDLHVGVLHYDPSFEPFPLLTDPVDYEPNTLNLREDKPMLHYWLNVLSDSIQNIMAKAMASEGGTAGGCPLLFFVSLLCCVWNKTSLYLASCHQASRAGSTGSVDYIA